MFLTLQRLFEYVKSGWGWLGVGGATRKERNLTSGLKHVSQVFGFF